jgi:excisionase family DNA binding protein
MTVISVDAAKSSTGTGPETPCLAMRPREAAKALGISERLLWDWTNRGIVPHVRLGKAILYPVDVLQEWLKQQAQPPTVLDRKNFQKS